MHPALRMSVLDELPSTVQRMALAAAGGSEENLCTIQRLVDDIPHHHREKSRVFLPVFYTNLDQAKIPIGDELDDPSMFTAGPVHSAMISLHQIHSMALRILLPANVFSDLWPKLWKWVQFFDAYRFADANETGPALVTSRADVEEFMEGAGGSIEDMASLILGYVDLMAQDDFGLGGEIFHFIHNVETCLDYRPVAPPMLGPLCSALCSAGKLALVVYTKQVVFMVQHPRDPFFTLFPVTLGVLINQGPSQR
ncbi:hypothetical protein C8F04DRAFT_1344199 [Mycena alexandri]|uniref:Uncharacterized protein n=1 Tax=Mycena alexandri TaxID=1745969 RepID=A0AAD6SWJ6_9AGAR|nr:hypothetical protein C8F04DRAFT_1344199 [Mycena alexandri]